MQTVVLAGRQSPTVGLDERTWLDENGHVKSADAKVEERYK